jgi:signal transduction histidine kinase
MLLRDKSNLNLKTKTPTLDRQGRIVFISMVIIGYIVTFAWISIQDGRRITNEEIFWGILLGVVYALLGLFDHIVFKLLPAGWAEIFYFSVQSSLILGIGWILGVGGNVLIALPLVAFAVDRLRSWQRFVVYGAIVATIVLPLGLRFETWTTTLINGVTAAIYVLFIALFVHMRENEQKAREQAETLTAELAKANSQLGEYATQAEELAITQERNRLAREIHDNLGHTMTVVNIQIEAARTVMESDPKRAKDALKKAQDLTKKSLSQVRESVSSLRESPISNRPLEEAIASLVHEMNSTGIVTEFVVSGKPVSLDHKIALAFYRVAQEALTNVSRHARASRVDACLIFRTSEVALVVEDNGIGTNETGGGFGILGIKERLQLLGGSMEIHTAVGQGFRITAIIPLSLENKGAE